MPFSWFDANSIDGSRITLQSDTIDDLLPEKVAGVQHLDNDASDTFKKYKCHHLSFKGTLIQQFSKKQLKPASF